MGRRAAVLAACLAVAAGGIGAALRRRRRRGRGAATGRTAAKRRRLERIESTLELTALVDEAVEYATTLLGVDAALVELRQGPDPPDAIVFSSGLSRRELELHGPALESLADVHQGLTEVRYDVGGAEAAEDAIGGGLAARFGTEGEVSGSVAVFWRRSGIGLDERSVAELQALVQALAKAARHRERLPVLAHAPTRDRLTGLHNRRFFESDLAREVDRSRRHNRRFVLLVVDVDDFGEINERLGRQGADAVLAEVAGRLVTTIRTSDSAARIGRDEFGFILVDSEADAAAQVFARFRSLLERSVGLTSVTVSASAGAIEFGGDEPEALLARARQALANAKESGQGQIVVESD